MFLWVNNHTGEICRLMIGAGTQDAVCFLWGENPSWIFSVAMSVASANPAQTLRHPSGHFWTLEFGESGFIVSVTWSALRSVKSNVTTFISRSHRMSSSSLPALPILPGYEVTEGPEQRTGFAHLNLTPYCVFSLPFKHNRAKWRLQA